MPRLGEILLQQGVISGRQLDHALQAHQSGGMKLGTHLVNLGYISDQALTRVLSRQLKVPHADPRDVATIPRAVANILPGDLAKKCRAVPLRIEERVLHVCMDEPTNLKLIDTLRFRTNRDIKPFVVTEAVLDAALERHYDVGRQRDVVPKEHPAVAQAPAQVAPKPKPVSPVVSAMEFADVRSHADLLDLLRRFLGGHFRQFLLLRIHKGDAGAIAQHGLQVAREGLGRVRAPIVDGSLLQDALTHSRVVQRQATDDKLVLKLCDLAGMRAQNLTILPIANANQDNVYVALCNGLSPDQLRTLFPRLRTMLTHASCALHILALRRQILRLQ